jgi:hypothetical protein
VTAFRPTPQQERWMHITARLGGRRDTPWIAERSGGWTAATSIARCALFVLGAFAAGLTAAIVYLKHVPGYLIITGLILIAAAEWLIVRRRFFGAGVEEALELAGLLMIAIQMLNVTTDSLGVHISLLAAMMLLIAGLRLLNPLFITLSVVALSSAVDFSGYSVSRIPAASMASIFCLAAAWVAMYINRLRFRRPSYDQMFAWLVVTMPLAGYLWFETNNRSGLSFESLRVGPVRFLPVLMLMIFGLTALIVGIRQRRHALLIAFLICVGCVAFELRNLTTLSLQVKLIWWGSVVLLLTLGLDRYLRTPRRGITSRQFEENKGSLELLQLAGASAIAPQSVRHPGTQIKGSGGSFGGGGASGNF